MPGFDTAQTYKGFLDISIGVKIFVVGSAVEKAWESRIRAGLGHSLRGHTLTQWAIDIEGTEVQEGFVLSRSAILFEE